MVTMLLEDVNDLKQQYKNIPEDIFNKLLMSDPTYKGNITPGDYTTWLLNLYNNDLKNNINNASYKEMLKKYPDGINPKTNTPIIKAKKLPSITENDIDTIKQLLRDYHTIRKESKVNINQIKSIDELEQVIQSIKDKGVPTDPLTYHIYNVIQKAKKKGFKIIFENDMWLVGIPTTKESSVIFGEDTRWCTTQATKQHYEEYTETGENLYIFYNKLNGSLYQYSPKTNEFHNADNERFDINKKIISTDKEISKFCLNMIGGFDIILQYILSEIHSVELIGDMVILKDNVQLLDPLINSQKGIHCETIKHWIKEGFADFSANIPDDCDSLKDFEPECFKKAHLPIDWKAIDYIFVGNYQLYLAKFGQIINQQLTNEEVDKIYNLLNTDYYQGKSAGELIQEYTIKGVSDNALKYITDKLKSIPNVTAINYGNNDDNIVITLSKEQVISIYWDCLSEDSKDWEWFDILYYLNGNRELTIDVPDYGWYGFDDYNWEKASKAFINNLKEILNKNNINESINLYKYLILMEN